RSVDRLAVTDPAPDLECAGSVQHERRRPPVELRLRHEAEPSAGPERHPERPGIEVGEVVAREDATATLRDVLDSARTQPKGPVQDRPAQHPGHVVDERHTHGPEYRGQQRWLS